MFKFVFYNICSANKYLLVVAMVNNTKDDNYERELSYYNSNKEHPNIKFVENDRINYSTYNLGFTSKIIIGLWSTLAFEMFGAGRRTLFGGILHTPQKDIYVNLFDKMQMKYCCMK